MKRDILLKGGYRRRLRHAVIRRKKKRRKAWCPHCSAPITINPVDPPTMTCRRCRKTIQGLDWFPVLKELERMSRSTPKPQTATICPLCKVLIHSTQWRLHRCRGGVLLRTMQLTEPEAFEPGAAKVVIR